MANERLYKTFDKSLIDEIAVKATRSYYFINNNENINLKETKINELSSEQIFKLDDDTGEWIDLRKSQSLFLNLKVNTDCLVNIFRGERRVCYKNTTLGFGMEWRFKNSKVKKCIKLGVIDDTIDKFECEINDIEISHPDDEIEFYWFIYVIDPGSGEEIEGEKFGNIPGIILTKNLFWKIITSGNGSVFPIDECYSPSAPLWSIRCSFSDWCIDEFSTENLAITLNKAHPLYPLIKYNGDSYVDEVFKEVLSSAIVDLIIQILIIARENGNIEDIDKKEKGETGSILSAIHYFKDSLGFNIYGKPEVLISSVKTFIDKGKKL